MLDSGGWKYYTLTMQSTDDSRAGLQFSRTQIYVPGEEDPYVDVVHTQFSLETNADTTEDYEASLEVRFPFSLLKKKSKSRESPIDWWQQKKPTKLIDLLTRLLSCILPT